MVREKSLNLILTNGQEPCIILYKMKMAPKDHACVHAVE